MRKMGKIATALFLLLLLPRCKGEEAIPEFEALIESPDVAPAYASGMKGWAFNVTLVNNSDLDMSLDRVECYIYNTDTGYTTRYWFHDKTLPADRKVKSRDTLTYPFVAAVEQGKLFNSGQLRIVFQVIRVDGDHQEAEVVVNLLR